MVNTPTPLKIVSAQPDVPWPPSFTVEQEKVLNLLIGDRFYTNPSASLREAVLNAIDAIHRRRKEEPHLIPSITLTFNEQDLTLEVADNGIGMSKKDVTELFTKVGASAAAAEAKKDSVGEFGIGVISYFMAGDTFDLHTYDGVTEPIGLGFSKQMIGGGEATPITSKQENRGTTVKIYVKDNERFNILLKNLPHWCRDVEGLSAIMQPENRVLRQGGAVEINNAIEVEKPQWVERAHLGPIAYPTGWDTMTGISTVAVLYRGVFVQEFQIRGIWGIEGSIDIDPKKFKPRLNREAFIEGEFQTHLENFLKSVHPKILEEMAKHLQAALNGGELDKWTVKRWANLWLSIPRANGYTATAKAWDSIFRSLPAFELAVENQWRPISLDEIKGLEGPVWVAPLAEDKPNEVVQAAVRYCRNTGKSVVRGIRRDQGWMREVSVAYGTTADLISSIFSAELPPLVPISGKAEEILSGVNALVPLFSGPPVVDIVRIGKESAPILKLNNRFVINADHAVGHKMIIEILERNEGPRSLIEITAVNAFDQLAPVASSLRNLNGAGEILSPIRRRMIRSLLQ